ncbi:MAG TPA: hypothetical protein VNE86_07810 [Nitrososphaerales archaeon]|nr:hypothetical protein [Nitrososphaerales archaeon]
MDKVGGVTKTRPPSIKPTEAGGLPQSGNDLIMIPDRIIQKHSYSRTT